MATRASTSVRLDDSQVARLDRIVDGMRARLAGLDVGRSTALRLALERGMDALDLELGLRVRSPTKGKTTRAKTTRAKTTRAKTTRAKTTRAKTTSTGSAKAKASRAKPADAKAKQANAAKTKSTANQRGKKLAPSKRSALPPRTRRRERTPS